MTLRPFLLCFLLVSTIPVLRAENPAEFKVHSATGGGSFSLTDAKGKWVALHFLLKTECPVCLRHTNDYLAKATTLPDVAQVFLKPDTKEEIEAWAGKIPDEKLKDHPIYRDVDAQLAEAYGVPGGYEFHGQTVHFPALILLDPEGREVFRYIGKNNGDRYSFEDLAAKVKELQAAR